IATGAALGSQMNKDNKVTVCFFGDGASNQGAFHESLNLASVWKLPIVYVCENNLYAETTPQTNHQAIQNIADRAVAYGMPGVIADGMDVISVYNVAQKAIDRARSGEGPTLLEAKTYRYRGHWEGDPQPYRTKTDIEEWKKKDPITNFEKFLLNQELITSDEIEALTEEIANEINDAIEFGRTSPFADPQACLSTLYFQ
ncbi:MAG: thiamine pyrophosphate-dependent dehydrogenase E1 component subunit alpha, partial [Candidatus Atribacteria bacterium]|nr:thiamine pyrophosphate-dependent dehydrogenase E1 component subunit alpha [Candidatus Atribacteria bacterium]